MRQSLVLMTLYTIYETVLSKVTIETLLGKNYYRVDTAGPLVMIFDTQMATVDPLEMDEKAKGELLHYAR